MPHNRLRSALFSRRKDEEVLSDSRSAVAETHISACSWNSTHEDFTRLRLFVWTGGDPGFTLTTSRRSEDNAATAFTCDEDAELRVDRVTALKVWEAGIRPGDVLETVSGKRVHTMDTEAAIVLVQMSKSPAIIRFRSSTSGKCVRFDVLLGRQKLGLFFTGDGSRDIPVVTRISNRSSSDSTSPSGARVGDILVAVNGMDAVAAGLSATTKHVEVCPRPLRLTFERAAYDDELFGSQTASEHSGEDKTRLLSLRKAIPSLSVPGRARCKEFLRTLMPPGVRSTQLEAGDSNHGMRSSVLIEWKSGPLGLTLLEDAISGAPVVNRLTGKGSSANMELLHHGFQLSSINGVQTEGRALEDLYHDLLTLPKPLNLVFRPPEADDTSEEDNSSEDSSNPPSPDSNISSKTEAGLDEGTHRTLVAAQHHCPQQSSLIREQHEYEVVWTAAQLGLQLEILDKQPGNTSSRRLYPIVHKILKESTLGLSSDAVGHLFVSVNNWSTSNLSATELRTLLHIAPKPAILRFRRREGLPGFQRTFVSSSSYDVDERVLGRHSAFGSAYNILWSEGALGITFGCYEDADRRNALVVYVKCIGPGQAQNSKLVALGDILRTINGQEIPPKQKFKKTMRALINRKQPVTLGFHRLLVERCSDWRS